MLSIRSLIAKFRLLFPVIALAFFTACGGGGSSEPTPTPTNNAPVISGFALSVDVANMGESVTIDGSASDADGDSLTTTYFAIVNSAEVALTSNAAVCETGMTALGMRVTDGKETTEQQANLTCNNVPQVTNVTQLAEDFEGTYNVTATATDVDMDITSVVMRYRAAGSTDTWSEAALTNTSGDDYAADIAFEYASNLDEAGTIEYQVVVTDGNNAEAVSQLMTVLFYANEATSDAVIRETLDTNANYASTCYDCTQNFAGSVGGPYDATGVNINTFQGIYFDYNTTETQAEIDEKRNLVITASSPYNEIPFGNKTSITSFITASFATPVITLVSGLDNSFEGLQTVSATVYDQELNLNTVNFFWRLEGSTDAYTEVAMTDMGSDTWSTDLTFDYATNLDENGTIEWYIEATDLDGYVGSKTGTTLFYANEATADGIIFEEIEADANIIAPCYNCTTNSIGPFDALFFNVNLNNGIAYEYNGEGRTSQEMTDLENSLNGSGRIFYEIPLGSISSIRTNIQNN